jgi:hypothetical protein
MDPTIQSEGSLAITILMMALAMALLALLLTYVKQILHRKNQMMTVSNDV